jgi:hypothetical protein
MPKSVKFDCIVRVCLINTRKEYNEYGIANEIWWSQNELEEIRKEILREIRLRMVKCPEKSFDTCHNETIENHCEY